MVSKSKTRSMRVKALIWRCELVPGALSFAIVSRWFGTMTDMQNAGPSLVMLLGLATTMLSILFLVIREM
jgi:hypothetical protein